MILFNKSINYIELLKSLPRKYNKIKKKKKTLI